MYWHTIDTRYNQSVHFEGKLLYKYISYLLLREGFVRIANQNATTNLSQYYSSFIDTLL